MWLMSNRDVNNIIMAKQDTIAKKCGVSKPVVNEAIKLLIGIDFMKKGEVRGTYMLNPDAIFQGNRGNRFNVLLRYEGSEEFNETKVSENPDTFVQTKDERKIEKKKNNKKAESINKRKEYEKGNIPSDD